MYLQVKGKLLSLETPIVMGIANYTDDSFFDGGKYNHLDTLLKRVEVLLSEGADIVDIGAMSTRPGATDISEKEENQKIKEAVRVILKHFPDIILSVDTWRASVAEMAVEEGVAMINDISGAAFDPKMISVMGKLKVPYCLMHTTAKPKIMHLHTQYDNLIADMLYFFGEKLKLLKEAGVNDIMIDPGFGFGKTLEQNYHILNNLETFTTFQLPLLVGISRKSMIYNTLNISPEQALNGTTALHLYALMKGANILRVHDVKEAKETIVLYRKISHL